jgi:hypothetical protein
MRGTKRTLWVLIVLAAWSVAPGGLAATRRKPKATATPAATPTPTPPPYLRAAGACVKYEPGHYLIVAEVGETGRAFRIDAETSLEVRPVLGARIRVLYVEDSDGPVARRVLPGPAPVPTPVR